MYVVILAGGSGTRFWPLSRKSRPKQLMSVLGGKSMLQRTVERVLPLHPKRILIVTNEVQAEETRRQLAELQTPPVDVIAEPVGRNTAPAIGLAAKIIAEHDTAGVMVVLPADHFISDIDVFVETLQKAADAARKGYLVTLGIAPTRPETGYGYIEAESVLRGDGPYPVRRFVEKPDLERAIGFLEAGNFYWNSGMFVWCAGVILDEMAKLMPELAKDLENITFDSDVWEISDLTPKIARMYSSVQSQSVDYGIMEKSERVVVIPARFPWSDVGSWNALPEVLPADAEGNIFIETPLPLVHDSHDCLAYGDGKAVALVGVQDVVVVRTSDAVLVCHRDRAQDVKKIVEDIERRNFPEYL